MSFWCVYMLLCADGSIYTGSTNNIERRVKQHREGKGARYTRGRLPAHVIYMCPFPDRSSAQAEEACIKKMTHEQKWKFCAAACSICYNIY